MGFAKNILHYTDLVNFNGHALRSTIGGTGLSVSAYSQHKEWAVRFAEAIASEECQSTFYVQHGGQPAHKVAWKNDAANQLCNQFFRNVLPTMENGYLRPRYHGYLHFQDRAGEPLHHFLLHGGSPKKVLDSFNHMYRQSLEHMLVKP